MSVIKNVRRLLKCGISILPLAEQSKVPVWPKGVYAATADEKVLLNHFKKHPTHNYGIATGVVSQIFGLDIDGKEGRASLGSLLDKHGALPKTWTSRTAKGRHYIFRCQIPLKSSAGRLGRGIDTRNEAGYLVGPGSVHPSGAKYRWVKGRSPDDVDLADAPQWIVQLLQDDKPQEPNGSSGQRNNSLVRFGGLLRNAGASDQALTAALQAQNAALEIPLDEGEVQKIIGSVKTMRVHSAKADIATEVANAFLTQDFKGGSHLIYGPNGRFYAFNGKYWDALDTNVIKKRLLTRIDEIPDLRGKSASALMGQAVSLLTAKQSRHDDPLRFASDPPSVINCSNGEVWIDENGSPKLRSHRADSYLRHCLNVEYDPDATCPKYDKTVREIFSEALPSTKGMVRAWHDLAGYLIQPRRPIPTIVILKGSGSNGKTKLMETVTRILGSHLVSAQRIENLDGRFALSGLSGKYLLLDDDVRVGIRLPDGQLKKISEAKVITGEEKHGPTFNFVVRAVPVLLCNNVPSLADISHGMRRRLLVIPFDRSFKGAGDSRNLFDEIWQNEMSGVLNRYLAGLRRVIIREWRFKKPKSVAAAEAEWLADANPMPAFLDERCVKVAGAKVLQSVLYSAYNDWAHRKGYTKLQQEKSFGRNLENCGITTQRSNRGKIALGVKLR